MRLTAARTTIDTINSAESTISGDIGSAPIKLAAEVGNFTYFFVVDRVDDNLSAVKFSYNCIRFTIMSQLGVTQN